MHLMISYAPVFLSHLLYATVKIKHLKAAFVGKLCYLWESKSVMFCKWECTFQSWVGTFVTKLFLLLIKREFREICVHVGLSEYLWGLTTFIFLPSWSMLWWFWFREDTESAEVTSVVVLYHCHCTLRAPAEEGGRLSLDLSEGSVILQWAISPVQPGKPRWWLQSKKAMNWEPQRSFSLPVMIASFYNRSLSRSSEMNLGKCWVSPRLPPHPDPTPPLTCRLLFCAL